MKGFFPDGQVTDYRDEWAAQGMSARTLHRVIARLHMMDDQLELMERQLKRIERQIGQYEDEPSLTTRSLQRHIAALQEVRRGSGGVATLIMFYAMDAEHLETEQQKIRWGVIKDELDRGQAEQRGPDKGQARAEAHRPRMRRTRQPQTAKCG